MLENSSTPKIILKKKQVPVIMDFCLDEGIDIGVRQQTFPDNDFEVELKLKDMKTAILVGMFLRENRFEVEGIDAQRYKKSIPKKDEKPADIVKPEPLKPTKEPASNNNLLAGLDNSSNSKPELTTDKKEESKDSAFLM